jgi:hypothetical protein
MFSASHSGGGALYLDMQDRMVFSREGHVVAIAEGNWVGVRRVDGGGERMRAVTFRLRGLAAFGNEVWIVDGTSPRLRRLDAAGRGVGRERMLADVADAALVPIALGAPAVTWAGTAIYDDLGAFREIAAPLTPRRWLAVRGPRVELGTGGDATAETTLARVTRAEVICDGAAIALVDEVDRELVVIVRSTGEVQHRRLIGAGPLRIASRRGLALVTVDPRHTEVVDLGAGRRLGAIRTDRDVAELAIDPDGRTVAIREACGGVELASLEAAMARGGAVAAGGWAGDVLTSAGAGATAVWGALPQADNLAETT